MEQREYIRAAIALGAFLVLGFDRLADAAQTVCQIPTITQIISTVTAILAILSAGAAASVGWMSRPPSSHTPLPPTVQLAPGIKPDC
jgi:hypothetical protein